MLPENETLWISNIKKAVAGLFRVPYLLSKPARSAEDLALNRLASGLPTSFQKFEETIYGKCLTRFVCSTYFDLLFIIYNLLFIIHISIYSTYFNLFTESV